MPSLPEDPHTAHRAQFSSLVNGAPRDELADQGFVHGPPRTLKAFPALSKLFQRVKIGRDISTLLFAQFILGMAFPGTNFWGSCSHAIIFCGVLLRTPAR